MAKKRAAKAPRLTNPCRIQDYDAWARQCWQEGIASIDKRIARWKLEGQRYPYYLTLIPRLEEQRAWLEKQLKGQETCSSQE